MDERFEIKNNFKIRSTGYPDLNNESIYLYGNKKKRIYTFLVIVLNQTKKEIFILINYYLL